MRYLILEGRDPQPDVVRLLAKVVAAPEGLLLVQDGGSLTVAERRRGVLHLSPAQFIGDPPEPAATLASLLASGWREVDEVEARRFKQQG